MTLALCLMFFLIGFLLSGRRSSPWEDARIIEGVAAHLRQWKGTESQHRLEDLQKLVAVLSVEIGKLSEDHVKLSGDKAKVLTKEWSVIRQALTECRTLLAQLEERYAISPEDGSILRDEIRRLARALADDEAARVEARKSSKTTSEDKSPSSESSEKEPPQSPQKAKSDDTPKKSSEKSREP